MLTWQGPQQQGEVTAEVKHHIRRGREGGRLPVIFRYSEYQLLVNKRISLCHCGVWTHGKLSEWIHWSSIPCELSTVKTQQLVGSFLESEPMTTRPLRYLQSHEVQCEVWGGPAWGGLGALNVNVADWINANTVVCGWIINWKVYSQEKNQTLYF